MSVSAAAILAVLMAHPSWADRRVPPDVRARDLEPVAEAIAEAVSSIPEAARVIALGMHEAGNFSLSVVLHGCEGMHAKACDRRTSRGFAQLKEYSCAEAYEHRAGTVDSLRAEARCAVRLMRGYAGSCLPHAASPTHAAFQGMALGHCGMWAGSDARVRTARLVEKELAKASQ